MSVISNKYLYYIKIDSIHNHFNIDFQMARGLTEFLFFIIIFGIVFYKCYRLSHGTHAELETALQRAEAVAGVSSFQSGGSEGSEGRDGSRCEECQLIARLVREKNPELLFDQNQWDTK